MAWDGTCGAKHKRGASGMSRNALPARDGFVSVPKSGWWLCYLAFSSNKPARVSFSPGGSKELWGAGLGEERRGTGVDDRYLEMTQAAVSFRQPEQPAACTQRSRRARIALSVLGLWGGARRRPVVATRGDVAWRAQSFETLQSRQRTL